MKKYRVNAELRRCAGIGERRSMNQSARGLAQSMTLREVLESRGFAGAPVAGRVAGGRTFLVRASLRRLLQRARAI